MQRLDDQGVVNLLGEADFHGITDPARGSYFSDPNKAPVIGRYQLGVLLER